MSGRVVVFTTNLSVAVLPVFPVFWVRHSRKYVDIGLRSLECRSGPPKPSGYKWTQGHWSLGWRSGPPKATCNWHHVHAVQVVSTL